MVITLNIKKPTLFTILVLKFVQVHITAYWYVYM